MHANQALCYLQIIYATVSQECDVITSHVGVLGVEAPLEGFLNVGNSVLLECWETEAIDEG